MHEKNIALLCDEADRLLQLNINLLRQMVEEPDVLSDSKNENRLLFDKQKALKRIEELEGEQIKTARREMVLAVVGTMKAGKSTTINAIVGQEILPNRNRPMTSVPTLIRHVPGKTEPVLHLEHIQPVRNLLITLQEKLATPAGQQVAQTLQQTGDTRELLDILTDDGWLKNEYHGEEEIFTGLASLNDLVRLAAAMGTEFPFDEYAEVQKLPVIDVEFSHLVGMDACQGTLTLLDNRVCQVLTCLPEKFVVDFANGIDVAQEHIRTAGERTFFRRLKEGLTGEGAARQNAINASLAQGVEASLRWLTEMTTSLATTNYAITSSYQMLPGYFRFVCQNGCVCGQSLGEVRVPHRGNVVEKVIEGAYEVVGVFDRIEEKRDAMQSLVLPPPARQALAQAALTYRYGDEHQPVTTADILTPRRREDYGKDLWSAYQTIQENMLKGGISGRSAKGKRIHTRAIHSIDTDIKLNRALWVMAETMLESLR